MARNSSKSTFKLASVLSFEKKLVPSDGYMYGTNWKERNIQRSLMAIPVKEKSVRGTVSNQLQGAVKKDPLKLNAKIENANPQTIDCASLTLMQDTLKLRFTLKVLPGFQYPSACNDEVQYKKIQENGNQYIEKKEFADLAHRYATNIANGRFLWRNRVGAEQIEIIVKNQSTKEELLFNAYEYKMKDFQQHDDNLDKLANWIKEALSGKKNYLLLEIEANVQMGKGQEVYPSQEMILSKAKEENRNKGDKKKVLYQVEGIAAMHSQKIGNALRTIDTWYPEYEDANRGPIAVETYGAVTILGRAFRSPQTKVDFYNLFERWIQGDVLSENEEEFVVAVLIRGGVFSAASGKE